MLHHALRSTRQVSELAFVASSVWIDTTSPYTTAITLPAGIVTGDLIVIVERFTAATTGQPTPAPPTGYTSLAGNKYSTEFLTLQLSYKIAGASESGATVNSGMSATATSYSAYALVFRKSPMISSVTPSTFNIIANSEPADYTITSGSAAAATLILSAAATRTSGSIPTHSLGGGGVRLIDDDSLSLVYAIQNTSHSDLLAAETESASVGAVFINGYLEAA